MRRKMLPGCCNKIQQYFFLLVYQEKKERVNSFCVLLHGNMITVALCHADFPRFRQSTGKTPVKVKLQNCVRFADQTMN